MLPNLLLMHLSFFLHILNKILLCYFGLTTRQVYFTHFEPSQLVGGVKTGDPQEKPPDHPQAELGLSCGQS